MIDLIALEVEDIAPRDVVMFALPNATDISTEFTCYRRSRLWCFDYGAISIHVESIDTEGHMVVHDKDGKIVYKSLIFWDDGIWHAMIVYDTFVDHVATEGDFKSKPVMITIDG